MGGEMKFKLIFGSQKVERGITTDSSEQSKPSSKGSLERDNNEKKAGETQDVAAAGIEESELRSIK